MRERRRPGRAESLWLISETDIVNGYMWLLGRISSAGEIAANRGYYETANGDVMQDFKRSLITSAEFRQQRLHCHKLNRSTLTELHRPRLVFLHIEKCGGTTLHALLAAHFDADRICPERHDGLGDWTVNELAPTTSSPSISTWPVAGRSPAASGS